ncbi:DUF4040 domain-containing protein [Permianibacter aggregans]|uniref:Multisubunit sodium/proton antiporter MrpB subunit n=1 Tax=Permianibacter aggregans TaxID=1510150 RepID=A0A4R6UR12_9GAMM|nr:DUF4040 domain-containing protein [Permianibacter aggregans]QGX38327.1 DUF4040 domain-containing protein [Permianibacter aggregans]TDQ48646.1 multisubunit sodium/proton antiporter MrpB subunit [Permianibacter aggregans]
MFILFGVFLLTFLIIISIAIIRVKSLFSAVMLSGIFSLLMAANFFILDAADVALTEAAIGAGITTVLFLAALALTRETEQRETHSRVPLLVLAIAAAPIIFATFDKPRLGDPNAPVHQHVAPWYLEKTPELIGIPNVVTAVLGSFRGYDTLGEVFVIFTAGIGVLFVFGVHQRKAAISGGELAQQARGIRHHLIPRIIGKIFIPVILLFALYVQFHGEYGPGGGFQAGAIFAAGLILYSLLEGVDKALQKFPPKVLPWFVASGALLYALVGFVCLALGGNFLDYSVLHSNPVVGQHIGLILIEIGVGVTVFGVMLSIFLAFAARESK